MSARAIGLIVNPIAGLGGTIGLKGSDSDESVRMALAAGVVPLSSERTTEALRELAATPTAVTIITLSDEMGAAAARAAGFHPLVLNPSLRGRTSARDTQDAARAMVNQGIDLLLFAGGDGTAADLADTIGERLLTIGIPTGVKMHSAVFGRTPKAAGRLARRVLQGDVREARPAEVADVDEALLAQGIVAPRLRGVLRVPLDDQLTQTLKTRSSTTETAACVGMARHLNETIPTQATIFLGPGTTTRAIAYAWGVETSLLGVDAISGTQVVALDANERTLLEHAARAETVRVVVAPIGGQGFVLGRGNQPLSARLLALVRPQHVIVVATAGKIASLGGRPLLVDTGDVELDAALAGYSRVVSDYHRELVYPVAA